MIFVGSFVLSLIAPTHSNAKPVYLNALKAAFPKSDGSLRCMNCHTNGPRLNLFGKDFADIKRELGNEHMNEVWFRLRTMDSDKDGVSNEDEINASKNPGVEEK